MRFDQPTRLIGSRGSRRSAGVRFIPPRPEPPRVQEVARPAPPVRHGGAWIDTLTIVMLCVVTGIGLLITIFSSGYMKGEAGYFRFIGRDDDLITSGGYRIGPGEIEACLQRHPAVKQAYALTIA